MSLSYTQSALFSSDVATGLSKEAYGAELPQLEAVYTKLQQQKHEGKLGFVDLLSDHQAIERVLNLANQLKGKFSQVVVIGIGGSDLGARAAFRALSHQYFNQVQSVRNGAPQLFFAGDTTDPDTLNQLIDVLDFSQTLLVMISKSGNTIEQMATFVALKDRLTQIVGEDTFAQHVVAITDGVKGTLRDLVNQEGYMSLVIPEAAGGRFSVLSAVGLFPLALVGIDIQAMLKGAEDINTEDDQGVSIAAHYAFDQYLAYQKGQDISVMFPYSYALREFGFWFRQLWAESLGKKKDLNDQDVHVGPTPIAAVGPTDQHSQVQLYIEGPNNKIFTFVRVENPERDYVLPQAVPDHPGVHYLAGLSLQRILLAEQEATSQALAQADRPSVVISIDRLDAYHLGQLFFFFELATAYAGALFNVNTFDQPGVELGKVLMFQKLGRPGY